MTKYEAVGYGNNRIKLKAEIGELVRRIFRSTSNPDRFFNLTYKIRRTKKEEIENGKYKISVFVYETDLSDGKYPVISILSKIFRWKYRLALTHNYLNIVDRILLYGIFPRKINNKRMRM